MLSFRGNLVLRWEWRPGSTLFLVGSRAAVRGDISHRVTLDDMWDSFGTEGQLFPQLPTGWDRLNCRYSSRPSPTRTTTLSGPPVAHSIR